MYLQHVCRLASDAVGVKFQSDSELVRVHLRFFFMHKFFFSHVTVKSRVQSSRDEELSLSWTKDPFLGHLQGVDVQASLDVNSG